DYGGRPGEPFAGDDGGGGGFGGGKSSGVGTPGGVCQTATHRRFAVSEAFSFKQLAVPAERVGEDFAGGVTLKKKKKNK
ncbi:hypothetical protein, partial [Enterobacter hormaechei]|uniref:hypothetical protein n=1 Tax=Enterobacter hormaechei TaxID=158836 RepID=UPI001F230BBB